MEGPHGGARPQAPHTARGRRTKPPQFLELSTCHRFWGHSEPRWNFQAQNLPEPPGRVPAGPMKAAPPQEARILPGVIFLGRDGVI